MLGFTIDLKHKLTADDYNYLIAMRNAGFTAIYVSLLNPETDTAKQLQELARWSNNLDLKIFAAVSTGSLHKLEVDLNDVGEVQSLGLSGVKVTADTDQQTIAKLSKSMPVAVDATLLTTDQLVALREYNVNLTNLIAGYNFYSQPETGIDLDWFKEKNVWLQQKKLTIAAFIPGDQDQSSPTLEKERHQHPLAALLEMQQLGCQQIFIGDDGLQASTIAAFTNYLKGKGITLRLQTAITSLTANAWHNLPYVARDVIRLQGAKNGAAFALKPEQTIARPRGSITCENDRSPLAGEIEITKRDLPAAAQVNVLTRIVPADVPLLQFIGPGTRVVLVNQK